MRRAFLAAVAFVSSSADATDDGMVKYKNWLPTEIRSMTEEARRSSVPIVYVQVANTPDILIYSALNTLMYNGLSDPDGAKREFQRDLNEPQTGNLTVGQLDQLFYRAERTSLTEVAFFPGNFYSEFSESAALVKGTTKIIDENIDYPINFTEIKCIYSELTCVYRQFILQIPEKNSWTRSYFITEKPTEKYKVVRWDGGQIDAKPVRASACRIPELKLNFARKEFYEIVTNAPEGECDLGMGVSLPILKKPRISQIVDGDPIRRNLFRSIREESYQFLNRSFRSRVEAELQRKSPSQ